MSTMPRISYNQLLKLQKKYKTDQSIACLYGVSQQYIHKLRKKYGILPVSDRVVERNKEIYNHYYSGLSGRKLAQRYNLSKSQIYRIIADMKK